MTQTVLLTGASGYIARHILVRLLGAGYDVRASLRDAGKGAALMAEVTPHLADAAAAGRVSFVSLDLGQDAGWTDALRGVDALVHTASPFPMDAPKSEDELITPAVDGTRRALRAASAAGVRRVVLTSSVAAMMGVDGQGRTGPLSEEDWTDPDAPRLSAYAKSKTLAEMAAWEHVNSADPEMQLTTINPGFVTGAPIGRATGTSMGIIRRILSGKDPMLPKVGFALVAVGDVAEAHVRALSLPESAGERVLMASKFLWFRDLARIVAEVAPGRKIPTREAPIWAIRLYALFDSSVRSVLPMLGKSQRVDNSQARDLLGIDFADPELAFAEAARAILAEEGG